MLRKSTPFISETLWLQRITCIVFVANNSKASFDYEFLETLEVGIKLSGSEVKSIKGHHGSLNGAYVAVIGGELVLLGAHIPAWQEKNAPAGYDPYQTRLLLVHKKEDGENPINPETTWSNLKKWNQQWL